MGQVFSKKKKGGGSGASYSSDAVASITPLPSPKLEKLEVEAAKSIPGAAASTNSSASPTDSSDAIKTIASSPPRVSASKHIILPSANVSTPGSSSSSNNAQNNNYMLQDAVSSFSAATSTQQLLSPSSSSPSIPHMHRESSSYDRAYPAVARDHLSPSAIIEEARYRAAEPAASSSVFAGSSRLKRPSVLFDATHQQSTTQSHPSPQLTSFPNQPDRSSATSPAPLTPATPLTPSNGSVLSPMSNGGMAQFSGPYSNHLRVNVPPMAVIPSAASSLGSSTAAPLAVDPFISPMNRSNVPSSTIPVSIPTTAAAPLTVSRGGVNDTFKKYTAQMEMMQAQQQQHQQQQVQQSQQQYPQQPPPQSAASLTVNDSMHSSTPERHRTPSPAPTSSFTALSLNVSSSRSRSQSQSGREISPARSPPQQQQSQLNSPTTTTMAAVTIANSSTFHHASTLPQTATPNSTTTTASNSLIASPLTTATGSAITTMAVNAVKTPTSSAVLKRENSVKKQKSVVKPTSLAILSSGMSSPATVVTTPTSTSSSSATVTSSTVTPVTPSNISPLTPSAVAVSSTPIATTPASPAATIASPPSTASSAPPLSTVTNWRRGELLGQGAYGQVFLGLNTDTGQLLAVKQVELHMKHSSSASKKQTDLLLSALESEITLMSGLIHPNIVRYVGSQRSEKYLNIFLEFVSGGSLSSVLKSFGRFSEKLVKVYTKQILSGLEYLHRFGIIHRDIKGANILITQEGIIKLADFGAATRLEQVSLDVGVGPKSLHGTPFWMAPEVLKQTGHSHLADIWSLGCTIIEMLTGVPPWSRQCKSSTHHAMFLIAMSNEYPELPSGISVEAKHFIMLCLERDIKKRPNTTRLLNHPFVNDKKLSLNTSWNFQGMAEWKEKGWKESMTERAAGEENGDEDFDNTQEEKQSSALPSLPPALPNEPAEGFNTIHSIIPPPRPFASTSTKAEEESIIPPPRPFPSTSRLPSTEQSIIPPPRPFVGYDQTNETSRKMVEEVKSPLPAPSQLPLPPFPSTTAAPVAISPTNATVTDLNTPLSRLSATQRRQQLQQQTAVKKVTALTINNIPNTTTTIPSPVPIVSQIASVNTLSTTKTLKKMKSVTLPANDTLVPSTTPTTDKRTLLAEGADAAEVTAFLQRTAATQYDQLIEKGDPEFRKTFTSTLKKINANNVSLAEQARRMYGAGGETKPTAASRVTSTVKQTGIPKPRRSISPNPSPQQQQQEQTVRDARTRTPSPASPAPPVAVSIATRQESAAVAKHDSESPASPALISPTSPTTTTTTTQVVPQKSLAALKTKVATKQPLDASSHPHTVLNVNTSASPAVTPSNSGIKQQQQQPQLLSPHPAYLGITNSLSSTESSPEASIRNNDGINSMVLNGSTKMIMTDSSAAETLQAQARAEMETGKMRSRNSASAMQIQTTNLSPQRIVSSKLQEPMTAPIRRENSIGAASGQNDSNTIPEQKQQQPRSATIQPNPTSSRLLSPTSMNSTLSMTNRRRKSTSDSAAAQVTTPKSPPSSTTSALIAVTQATSRAQASTVATSSPPDTQPSQAPTLVRQGSNHNRANSVAVSPSKQLSDSASAAVLIEPKSAQQLFHTSELHMMHKSQSARNLRDAAASSTLTTSSNYLPPTLALTRSQTEEQSSSTSSSHLTRQHAAGAWSVIPETSESASNSQNGSANTTIRHDSSSSSALPLTHLNERVGRAREVSTDRDRERLPDYQTRTASSRDSSTDRVSTNISEQQQQRSLSRPRVRVVGESQGRRVETRSTLLLGGDDIPNNVAASSLQPDTSAAFIIPTFTRQRSRSPNPLNILNMDDRQTSDPATPQKTRSRRQSTTAAPVVEVPFALSRLHAPRHLDVTNNNTYSVPAVQSAAAYVGSSGSVERDEKRRTSFLALSRVPSVETPDSSKETTGLQNNLTPPESSSTGSLIVPRTPSPTVSSMSSSSPSQLTPGSSQIPNRFEAAITRALEESSTARVPTHTTPAAAAAILASSVAYDTDRTLPQSQLLLNRRQVSSTASSAASQLNQSPLIVNHRMRANSTITPSSSTKDVAVVASTGVNDRRRSSTTDVNVHASSPPQATALTLIHSTSVTSPPSSSLSATKRNRQRHQMANR